MADDPHGPLDGRLRAAFEPDPRTAARVAGRALSERASTRRRGWLGAAAAAAVVCLAAALAYWPSRPAPQVEPEAAVLSGSLTDGLLVVPLPDGSTSILGGEARQDRPDEGYGIVLVEGELR